MRKVILLITFILIFLIYTIYQKNSIRCLIVSDNDNNVDYYLNELLESKYHHVSINSSYTNTRINGLITDIEKNKTIRKNDDEYFIKKELRECDYLILNIGIEELKNIYKPFEKDNSSSLDELLELINNLIVEVKKYAKDRIIFIGYYNPSNYYDQNTDSFFYEMDLKLNRLMMNNSITYISTYQLVKGNPYKKNQLYLNAKGEEKIANLISFYID